jgi:hypothetical protein
MLYLIVIFPFTSFILQASHSFGEEVRYLSHVPALRHVKEPSNLVNCGLLAKFLGLSSVLR